MEALAQILDRTCLSGSRPSSTASLMSAEEIDAHNERRVRWANDVQGHLEGYTCSTCKDKGFIMVHCPGGEPVARQCRCMGFRAVQASMRNSGLADAALGRGWEAWQEVETWQTKARETAQSYAKRVLTDPSFSGWLIVSGRPGAGKTLLCSLTLREILLGGKNGKYLSWRDFSRTLKLNATNPEIFKSEMNSVKNAKILYVDDFWKGKVTSADVSLAFEIFNHFYVAGKPLILSSEFSPEGILRADEALGSRLIERSRGTFLDLSNAKNWRLRDAVG